MRAKHVGDVVIVSDPEGERVPLGVVTDRDLVTEVLGNGRDAAIMPLSALAHTPVVIAAQYEEVHEVLERMRVHGVRRVPVVDGRGALVGIVTADDLLGVLLADVQTLLSSACRRERREQERIAEVRCARRAPR